MWGGGLPLNALIGECYTEDLHKPDPTGQTVFQEGLSGLRKSMDFPNSNSNSNTVYCHALQEFDKTESTSETYLKESSVDSFATPCKDVVGSALKPPSGFKTPSDFATPCAFKTPKTPGVYRSKMIPTKSTMVTDV